jgi:DNA polymerase elongation subunit (family B)
MTDSRKFQIVDIISDDITNEKDEKEFIITLYGIDDKNARVVCHVAKYSPYFYIKVPNEWDQNIGVKLIKDICDIRPGSDRSGSVFEQIKSVYIELCKDFYGLYLNGELGSVQQFHYLKVSMMTHGAMKKLISLVKIHYNAGAESSLGLNPKARLRLTEWRNVVATSDCDSNLYEATIHPVIKFIHDTGIEPTSWVQCRLKGSLKTGLFHNCDHEYSCSYKSLKAIEGGDVSSYRIAAFDIECDSSHGDFPLPTKDFKKVAGDIFDSYQAMLKNSPESRRLTINSNSAVYLRKLLSSAFTGDFTDFNSIYKYADMNKVHIGNNGVPVDEVYDEMVSEILNSGTNKISLQDLYLKGKDRDKCITDMQDIIEKQCANLSISVEGDPIIQIGTVFYDYSSQTIMRHILVIAPEDDLDDDEICDDLPGITVQRCKSERELLLGWRDIIREQDPDFITGYNIFGFDFKYIDDRAKVLFPCPGRCNDYYHVKGCPYKEFMNFGKMDSVPYKAKDHKCKKCAMKSQRLASSALGDNTLYYISMDGRILFDIQKEVQKGHNLESYSLDNVASHFMRGKIKSIDNCHLTVTSVGQLKRNDFVSFRTHTNIGEELFAEGAKFMIKSISGMVIEMNEPLSMDLDLYHKVEWCMNKDDISVKDIFDKHKHGGSKGRSEVAKYCVQDCELCINLLLLLDIIPNNLGMANVSYVPASYIFLRGQGVKVSSVVSRVCSERNTRIPDLKKIPRLNDYIKMIKNGSSECEIKAQIIEDSDWRIPKSWELDEWFKRIAHQAEHGMEGYEGAIVLDPKPGIYLDDPIAVLDYASLYPSSIIEKNISHETYIEDTSLLSVIGEGNYHTVSYQDWIYKNKGKGDSIEKIDANTQTTCHFMKTDYMVQQGMFQEGEKPMGIIPQVLDHLLSARKKTKNMMKDETDEFKKKVLDGLQLAYKVTANSVYGQLGAKTSTVFKMNLAACTTSIGRSRIEDASLGVKEWAQKKGYNEPDVIYGDTDSVFVKFDRHKNGTLLEGRDALQHCIQCGQEAGEYITKGILKVQEEDGSEGTEEREPILDWPQDLEYEKTFWPFILISKKRYTGDKYEFDINECKRDSMGIVLKRRDNAPIVKHIFGNVIERIMIDKDFDLALSWLKHRLQMIRDEEFILRYFVITKALRGYYKNPQQIAHKVLADRMSQRDPGNKPKASDRIPYAYIKLSDERLYDSENPYKSGIRKGLARARNVMQGDRIEHVDYIVEKELVIDYEFYITNQIMNPVKQVLDLVMDPLETSLLFSK